MTFEDMLRAATDSALEGTLTDATRVGLYKLALTMAADEFYRIESDRPNAVNPEVLIVIHQISTICEPDVNTDKLMDTMGRMAEMMGGAEDS